MLHLTARDTVYLQTLQTVTIHPLRISSTRYIPPDTLHKLYTSNITKHKPLHFNVGYTYTP